MKSSQKIPKNKPQGFDFTEFRREYEIYKGNRDGGLFGGLKAGVNFDFSTRLFKENRFSGTGLV